MVEHYVKTVDEHLRKMVSTNQRDWNGRLPTFLLACRALSHETMGTMPANVVFGRELCLPCDLLFGAPLDKEESTTDCAADAVERLHDIHHFARQHLKAASERIKAHYDWLANSAKFQEGNGVWLYRPTPTRGKSPKLQS
jgi:predicted metal-dependent hydrolase